MTYTLELYEALHDDVALPRRRALRSPFELVGAAYVRGGVTPESGFDCYTLLAYVRWHWYRKQTPMDAIPARALSLTAACAVGIRRTLRPARAGSPWRRCEPLDGCAVALGRSTLGRLHHCGVLIADGAGFGILHALDGLGVVWTPLGRITDLYARVECYELEAGA